MLCLELNTKNAQNLSYIYTKLMYFYIDLYKIVILRYTSTQNLKLIDLKETCKKSNAKCVLKKQTKLNKTLKNKYYYFCKCMVYIYIYSSTC